MNRELKHLSLWLRIKRLALNIKKTNFVIFRSYKRAISHNVTLKLDNKAIVEKKQIRYLGVYMDSFLN